MTILMEFSSMSSKPAHMSPCIIMSFFIENTVHNDVAKVVKMLSLGTLTLFRNYTLFFRSAGLWYCTRRCGNTGGFVHTAHVGNSLNVVYIVPLKTLKYM